MTVSELLRTFQSLISITKSKGWNVKTFLNNNNAYMLHKGFNNMESIIEVVNINNTNLNQNINKSNKGMP